MKMLGLVLGCCAIISSASAYPQTVINSPRNFQEASDGFVRVPISRTPYSPFGFNQRYSDDWEDDFPFANAPSSFRNPFGDVFSHMEAMLKEMKKEMDEIAAKTNTGTVLQISGNGFDPSSVKNETTSKTEVIDGNVVQVNETTFSTGDSNGGGVFRIKVINVRPKDDVETSTIRKIPKTDDVESVTPSSENRPHVSSSEDREDVENEINRGKEITNEVNNNQPESLEISNDISENVVYNNDDSLRIPIDLSHDTAVNDQLTDRQANGLYMADPDAEIIDVDKANNDLQKYYYSSSKN